MTEAHTESSTDGSELVNGMRIQLAASLPGLSDEDIHSLAVRTIAELEYRAGEALSSNLTEAQLAEFEQLLEHDDEQCTRWLENALPTYKATAAIVRAMLVAEVIETVANADATAVIGCRRFAEVLATSADLIEEHCRSRELKYTRTGETVRFAFAASETHPAVSIAVRLLGGDLLAITGAAAGVSFPGQAHDALDAFASRWNRDTWQPKAVVASASEPDRRRLIGEIATTLPLWVTQSHIDTLITDTVATMFAFFTEAHRSLMP